MKDLEILRDFYKTLEFKDGIKSVIVERQNGFDVEYTIEGNDGVLRIDHITTAVETNADGEKIDVIHFREETITTFKHGNEEITTRHITNVESYPSIDPEWLDAGQFTHVVTQALKSQTDNVRVSVNGPLTNEKKGFANQLKTWMNGALNVLFKGYDNPFEYFVVVVDDEAMKIYAKGKNRHYVEVLVDVNNVTKEQLEMVQARISGLFEDALDVISLQMLYAKATSSEGIETIEDDRVMLNEKLGVGQGLSRRLEVNGEGMFVIYEASYADGLFEKSVNALEPEDDTFFGKLIAIRVSQMKVSSTLKDRYLKELRSIAEITRHQDFLDKIGLKDKYEIVQCNDEYLIRLNNGLFLGVYTHLSTSTKPNTVERYVLTAFYKHADENHRLYRQPFVNNETLADGVTDFIKKLENWYQLDKLREFKNLAFVGLSERGETFMGKDYGKQRMEIGLSFINDTGLVRVTEFFRYFSITRSYDIDLDKPAHTYIEAYDNLDYYYKAQDALASQATAEGFKVPDIFKDKNTETSLA